MAKKVPGKFLYEDDDGSITPQCHGCAHWVKGTVTCVAFPDGIPVGILMNAIDHNKAVEGDNGITFKAATTDPEPTAREKLDGL